MHTLKDNTLQGSIFSVFFSQLQKSVEELVTK